MDGMLLLAGCAGLLAALGGLESLRHRRNLARIPIRIHVNGTRGKSSVTRLIAGGLRAGGLCTFAKTTGTEPQMILPDGSERPIFRANRANVIEQLGVVRTAAQMKADALVIECMALQPALQSLCELKIVRATHGVITNARPDHLDVMGPTTADVAWALAGSTPARGRLYTAEQKYLDVFRAAAADRNSELVAVEDDDLAAVTWDELAGFSHIEHPDNVALALAVCSDLGIDRRTALAGMHSAAPDPGVMSMYRLGAADSEIVFVNGFAANDPESTGNNWNMLIDRFPAVERRIALLNCRADRADRSVQLADACLRWKPADHYFLIGSATDVFSRRVVSQGLCKSRITTVEPSRPEQVVDLLAQRSGRSSLVMGMGNISGPGMQVIDYFRRRHVENAAAPRSNTPETSLCLQEAA